MDKKRIGLIIGFAGTIGTSLFISIRCGQLLLAVDKLMENTKEHLDRLDDVIIDAQFEEIAERFDD